MKKQKRGLTYTLTRLALIASLVLTPLTTRHFSNLEEKTSHSSRTPLINLSTNKNSISLQSNLLGYSTSLDVSYSFQKNSPKQGKETFSLFENRFPQIETLDSSEYLPQR